MKSHLARVRLVVTVAIAAGLGGGQAVAQYAPYNPYPVTQGYPGAQGTPGYRIAAAPATAAAGQAMIGISQAPAAPMAGQIISAQPQQNVYQAQRQTATQFPYQPAQPWAAGTTAAQPAGAQAYPTQVFPRYPQVAQLDQPQLDQPTPAGDAAMPGTGTSATSPATSPAGATPGTPGQVTVAPTGPADAHPHGYPQGGAPCATSYPSTGLQCGSGAQHYSEYGLGGYFDQSYDSTQWFGGLYFLFMERDNPAYQRLAVQAIPPTDPYFPSADTNALATSDADHDFREGIEVRFGSTFSGGGEECGHGANCNRCPPQLYAWEFAYWGLDRDISVATVTDPVPTDTFRIYSTVNHAGLEYDPGTGANPVNIYYDYQIPIVDGGAPVDGDVRVLAQRVRTNFHAYNLEINFLKFPVCDVGCGAGSGGQAFSMSALCGLRYFRMDDDFELATEFGTYSGGVVPEIFTGFDGNSANELYHDIQVENNLLGFQLGGSMNYCIASRWNVFADTNFGFYNNHINHYQRIYNPLGNSVRFTQDQRAAVANSDKDDIAFLGEMRLGGSYDLTCNWRAVLAYRAVAITGVALSTEQIRPDYSDWAEMARVDSGGSIVIHGVQLGLECRY